MLSPNGKLHRRALVAAVLEGRGDMAVIAGLGAPAWDITAVGDTALNLPLWGGMGGAAMIGLGLALAQPERRVLVITGDGAWRRGQTIPLKNIADEAVAMCPSIEHVLVVRRTEQDIAWGDKDLWWHEALAAAAPTCPPAVRRRRGRGGWSPAG
jgi:hypothetical protein